MGIVTWKEVEGGDEDHWRVIGMAGSVHIVMASEVPAFQASTSLISPSRGLAAPATKSIGPFGPGTMDIESIPQNMSIPLGSLGFQGPVQAAAVRRMREVPRTI